jgi:archaellum biogenesis ATPase FlaH
MKKNEFDSVYNIDVQRLLLSYLVDDPDIFVRCRNIVRDVYFDDELRRAVRFILGHVEEYSSLPSLTLIKAKTGVQIIKFSDYGENISPAWFLEEMERFCRYKALENVILEGYELLQKGEDANIEARVKEAMTISLVSDLGTHYFDDPRSRLERLMDKSSMVSTGWATLDFKLHGGFIRGGLNIFAGGPGSGKSLFLQNLALNWALAGYDVIYFTLELSEELVSLRLDSMITGRSTKEVFSNVDSTSMMVTEVGEKSGSLTIKKMPEGSTTTNDLRAYCKEYEIKTGRKPQCIVIDYLDLMYPNNKNIDLSSLFVKDKYVSEEIRGFMHETNTFGATASQLNRQSVEAQGEFDHSHIAGGISKINTADNLLAIFTNQGMKDRGEYDLIFLKTRSASAVGQRMKLHYDPSSMRITDMEEDPDKPRQRADLKKNYQAQKEKPLDIQPLDSKSTVRGMIHRPSSPL